MLLLLLLLCSRRLDETTMLDYVIDNNSRDRSNGSTGLWGYQASDQLHASCGGCCALFQTMHTWLGPCRKGSPGGGALTWQSGVAGSSDHQGSRRPGATAETERPVAGLAEKRQLAICQGQP